MTFDEFFVKKKIDLSALGKAEPALLSEFKAHFEQMGEKSFDHTKKYWFNKLRLQYHLAPEPKAERVIIENPLAEQTITATLAETTSPPPNVGFKPRFKPGMTKPAEPAGEAAASAPVAEPEKPAENKEATTPAPSLGFKPKFKAGVTKPAEAAQEPKEGHKEEKPADAPASPPPALGFKPKFKAGVTKPAEPAASPEEQANEQKPADAPATQAPALGFKPKFKAGLTKTVVGPEPKEEAKAAPLFKAPRGKGDDLTIIKGIGPVAAKDLNEQGITTFAQIAALSDEDIARIDAAMPFSTAQIEDWREQAKALAAEKK